MRSSEKEDILRGKRERKKKRGKKKNKQTNKKTILKKVTVSFETRIFLPSQRGILFQRGIWNKIEISFFSFKSYSKLFHIFLTHSNILEENRKEFFFIPLW
uniref:Uncharacterized protein n=1 Tax=Cacopsylla melanoneura TaxID=428564 RepID=A0A8D8ZHT9_9HEMI